MTKHAVLKVNRLGPNLNSVGDPVPVSSIGEYLYLLQPKAAYDIVSQRMSSQTPTSEPRESATSERTTTRRIVVRVIGAPPL
ncbi:hypothetical protein MJO28_005076 [Puccinia striiformis f. sp. tritici]|uniref:Uncharacterized protein n=1 Tax=Puccinia striiformis f. sp. tritici TaxID=168172 RepID=A0ACC0EJ96_9BASI|nr:hypothetical protein MJO28_005076 [Puccinia striiformis f. sp. tritici]